VKECGQGVNYTWMKGKIEEEEKHEKVEEM
jgi:hypothetical protein